MPFLAMILAFTVEQPEMAKAAADRVTAEGSGELA
jgi:hypothetical protein